MPGPRHLGVVAVAAATIGAASTRPATTHPIGTAADPRVRAELSTVIATLLPRVGPADDQAVARYRKQATDDADVALSAGGMDGSPMWRRGRSFDDGDNRAFLRQSERVLHDFKMDVPAVTRALQEQDAKQPLAGPRLELLADLEEGELTLLVRAVTAQPIKPER